MAITPEYELDVRGEKCPYPLIRNGRISMCGSQNPVIGSSMW